MMTNLGSLPHFMITTSMTEMKERKNWQVYNKVADGERKRIEGKQTSKSFPHYTEKTRNSIGQKESGLEREKNRLTTDS